MPLVSSVHVPLLPQTMSTSNPTDSANACAAIAVRPRQASMITGLSRATMYRLAARGQFPRPVRLGPRCSAWLVAELQEWIDARAKAR